MRTRTASFSVDIGVLAAIAMVALGLWIVLSVAIASRALAPSYPGIAPNQEIPTTQPAPPNGAPVPAPSAAPANTNDGPPAAPGAPDPAQSGPGTQPTGPGLVDPAQSDPYPPKPRFDEPIDPPNANVKPRYIGEGK